MTSHHEQSSASTVTQNQLTWSGVARKCAGVLAILLGLETFIHVVLGAVLEVLRPEGWFGVLSPTQLGIRVLVLFSLAALWRLLHDGVTAFFESLNPL